MRDCIFLLADSNMRAAFEGFLSRTDFHLSLGCGVFDFDERQDIRVAAGDNDPGLYTRGHELLRPFRLTHHRALVAMDAAWEGSPGTVAIKEHLTEQILSTGWQRHAFQVIVIDPELESWIWQQNNHVARGLGFSSINALMDDPDVTHGWPKGSAKPKEPKEILKTLLFKKRIPRSSAIYKKITSQVSVKHCQDSAFQELSSTFRTWFPPKAP